MGLLPSSDKALLQNNFAQKAINCRLTKGALEAYNAPLQVYSPNPSATNIKSIYRFIQNSTDETQYWFTFNTDVNVVKGAVAGDTQERTYFTGDGYPKVTDITIAVASTPYPASAYHLGTPNPATGLIATVVPFSPPSTTPAEVFVYTYTYVTPWGEESPPAPASNAVTVKIGDTVNLTGILVGPTGNYNVGTGAKKRIYRTATGTTNTSYQFLAEIPIAQTTYSDTTLTRNLGATLPTLNSNILPVTAIGLTNMANGIMAAFSGYDVYFCEAYKPYSWPVGYSQAVDFPVVGLGAFGNSLVVLTTGVPYIMSGTDPQAISVEKLSVPYSCVSKRSICKAFGDVVYASPDGLVSIGQSGIKVLTDSIMTRLEWQLYNPKSMLCAVWDDRIFMFYDTGTKKGCLCLDNRQGLVESSVYATAVYNDPVTGELYLAINDKIVKWNAGSALTYTWKSKYFTHPSFVNFSWGQVLATDYPVQMNVYANQELVCSRNVTSIDPIRLLSGFKSKYWEIELIGNTSVQEVVIAESMDELRSV